MTAMSLTGGFGQASGSAPRSCSPAISFTCSHRMPIPPAGGLLSSRGRWNMPARWSVRLTRENWLKTTRRRSSRAGRYVPEPRGKKRNFLSRWMKI